VGDFTGMSVDRGGFHCKTQC